MHAPVRPQTRVFDCTLLPSLANLGLAHGKIASQLNRLPASGPIAIAWRNYVTGSRAWLFERQSGDDEYPGGMAVMLCIPRQPSRNADVAPGHFAWLDSVDAFAVPLLNDVVTSPAIYCLGPSKRPPSCERDTQTPQLLMSSPSWMPAWTIYPPRGYSHGWRSLDAASDVQAETLWSWIAQLAAPHLAKLKAELLPIRSQFDQLACDSLEDFFNALYALETLLAKSIVRRFISHLNPEVVSSCVGGRMAVYPEEYNWVVGAKSEKAWEWRMDALRLFPAISLSAVFPCLAANTPEHVRAGRTSPFSMRLSHTEPVGGTIAFAEVVDEGRPLIKGLAQSFGVRPIAIRSLRGVSARTVAMFGHPPLGWEDILRTLNCIPPERHPRSTEQWLSFSVLYLECVRVYRAMETLSATLACKFMDVTARPWIAENSKNWLRSETRWRDTMQGLADLSDATVVAQEIRDLAFGLGLKATERYKAYSKFACLPPVGWLIYIQKMPHSEDLNTSLWHEVWSTRSIEGFPIRALNSKSSLREEGKAMNHCIFTYLNRLRTQRELAFAIGEDRTVDRSTALLRYERISPSEWHVSVKQQQAAFNRDPSPLSQSIARRICAELSSDRYASALVNADIRRAHRLTTAQTHTADLLERPQTMRQREATKQVIDRSALREPLLMFITGT